MGRRDGEWGKGVEGWGGEGIGSGEEDGSWKEREEGEGWMKNEEGGGREKGVGGGGMEAGG